jgi:hypothetical protein
LIESCLTLFFIYQIYKKELLGSSLSVVIFSENFSMNGFSELNWFLKREPTLRAEGMNASVMTNRFGEKEKNLDVRDQNRHLPELRDKKENNSERQAEEEEEINEVVKGDETIEEDDPSQERISQHEDPSTFSTKYKYLLLPLYILKITFKFQTTFLF